MTAIAALLPPPNPPSQIYPSERITCNGSVAFCWGDDYASAVVARDIDAHSAL